MQAPLAVQLRQFLTPVANGNESMPSASSPMHNVVPRKRNMERCRRFSKRAGFRRFAALLSDDLAVQFG